MKAEESITWEKIFQSWSLRANSGPEIIRKPKTLQEIHVPYERSGEYIFGYDWLSYREFEQRKASIEKGPTDFCILLNLQIRVPFTHYKCFKNPKMMKNVPQFGYMPLLRNC